MRSPKKPLRLRVIPPGSLCGGGPVVGNVTGPGLCPSFVGAGPVTAGCVLGPGPGAVTPWDISYSGGGLPFGRRRGPRDVRRLALGGPGRPLPRRPGRRRGGEAGPVAASAVGAGGPCGAAGSAWVGSSKVGRRGLGRRPGRPRCGRRLSGRCRGCVASPSLAVPCPGAWPGPGWAGLVCRGAARCCGGGATSPSAESGTSGTTSWAGAGSGGTSSSGGIAGGVDSALARSGSSVGSKVGSLACSSGEC